MATIWDADILIYCASVLADMARRGVNDVPRKLNLMPYDLLRAIGRPATGRAYELLAQALDRLVATTIKTNIRAENRREATFSWLDGWAQLVDEKTERSRSMTLELSNWFWEGVMMKGGVLSIDRAYFDITGGRERWLYRVARKHAGGAGEAGFAITMPVLFDKSGAEGQYRRFRFEMLKLAERNELPGYSLSVESARDGEPMIRMHRREPGSGGDGAAVLGAKRTSTRADGPTGPPASQTIPPELGTVRPSKLETDAVAPSSYLHKPAQVFPGKPEQLVDARTLIKSSVGALAGSATRGFMTDETIDTLRRDCAGWDLHALHAAFERWVRADQDRTPADWQRAFIGWVKRHNKAHRHELRC